MKQLEFGMRSAHDFAPKSAGEPRLWVRRLVVWSAPGVELRDIRLRPGLNVLWAPDPADRGDAQQRNAEVIGHGSGKTLFCRLLRYCLGEDRFAPDLERDSIAAAFPDGSVGAEVVVDGVTWAVVRPIGMGQRHRAAGDTELHRLLTDDMQAVGLEPFLDAIATVFRFDELAALVAGDHPRDVWRLALAWLSRDQECRFDRLLDWRSADSNSGSSVRNLSVQQLQDTLRALMGAITPAEYELRGKATALEAQYRDAKQEAGRYAWEARRLQTRLLQELELDPADLVSGRMALEPLRLAAKQRLDRSQEAEGSPDVDVTDLGVLRSESDVARQQVEDLQNRLSVLHARIPEIESLISRIEGEFPGASARVRGAEQPVCPVCEVPVDLALAEGCKLSHAFPNLRKTRQRLERLRQDRERERGRLQQQHEEEARIVRDLNPLRERARELEEQLRTAERARDTRSDAWFGARRLIDDVDRLDQCLAHQEALQSRVDALAHNIQSTRDRVGAFREAQAGIFGKLSRAFDCIIRTVIGTGASGRIVLDGNGLRASVQLGGDRSTAAIDCLKVIAFDLAAMLIGLDGTTHLPAFLIHDSPREADLGIGVYHRLFRFMRDLEGGSARSAFQYIVTTTTSPPLDLCVEPWLVQTLGGAADHRLLRRDL